ncbi:MAG: hypothetical protein JW818_02980, partial [Pirellulales bacterium]|nr:hypothetical protein [Pirellulales bacterium]
MISRSMREVSPMTASALFLSTVLIMGVASASAQENRPAERPFDGPYTGRHLDRVAFPIGGIGAGMFCLEGSGAVSHMSVRHRLELDNEPTVYAALCIKGKGDGKNTARVLQGPMPDWKYYGSDWGGRHLTAYGFPRYRRAEFVARFPFATIRLTDPTMPIQTTVVGWSPFTPPDADASSLPVGAMEYHFENTSNEPQEAVFSFHAENFMSAYKDRKALGSIGPIDGGFVLYTQSGDNRDKKGAFAVWVDDRPVTIDHCWIRQTRWGRRAIPWDNVRKGRLVDNPPAKGYAPGASLFVPFTLAPGEKKTIRVKTAWYVPETTLRFGRPRKDEASAEKEKQDTETCEASGVCATCALKTPKYYMPWYATKYKNIGEVAADWNTRYDDLRRRSAAFRDAFYDTTLPPEVTEAVAANLTILKTPTVLRQHDGRIWCFEGCSNNRGCCPGSCTHVWNYAQAICHLFPSLERGLRQNEFFEGQDATGAQRFRGNLPITPADIS